MVSPNFRTYCIQDGWFVEYSDKQIEVLINGRSKVWLKSDPSRVFTALGDLDANINASLIVDIQGGAEAAVK